MSEDTGHQAWIDAGLKEMGHGGVAQVRVEVLAKRLGVTKGGFYRRFKDRRALLDALLDTWSGGRIAAVEQQTALGNETAADRLKSVIRLYSERANPGAMAIELAIRQWARSDAAAAAAVAPEERGAALRPHGARPRRRAGARRLVLRIHLRPSSHLSRPGAAQARKPDGRLRRCFDQHQAVGRAKRPERCGRPRAHQR